MAQQECDDVKAMLEELGTLAQRAEALKKSIDSGEGIEEIKKTKEELQSVLKKHGMLRYNLKEWERRSKNIQRIDKIAEKLEKGGDNTNLSIDELHALYKQEMRSFGDSSPFDFSDNLYHKTEELKWVRAGERKTKEDYVRIYGCRPEQVTRHTDDLYNENKEIVVFIGDVEFTNEELPKTLKHVSGNLRSYSKKITPPQNLEYVGRSLFVTQAKEFTAPRLQSVGGGLSVENAQKIELPALQSVEGEFSARKAKKIEVEALQRVGGSILATDVEKFKTAALQGVSWNLFLHSLKSAKELDLQNVTIGGSLGLNSLKEIPAEGLVLPETIGGSLGLASLTSTEGLILPETVGEKVYLDGITKAERNELRKQRPDLIIIPRD